MEDDAIVICGAARTPMGAMGGQFAEVSASELGGAAIRAAMARARVSPEMVDDLLMGNVLSAGQGQAPARQAGFHAGLDASVPALTLNKMCGSGMKAVMMAHDQLKAGNGAVLIAGGMESMTRAPYLLPSLRAGARLGHTQAVDHMMKDGLEDAYDQGRAMGALAEDCAAKYQFTRKDQDAYALESLARATAAQERGDFQREICPYTLETRKGPQDLDQDEAPSKARPDKIPHLRPVFKKGGTITAANASSISDGAAALILMRESEARASGTPIRARIHAHASHSQAPQWFTTAPIGAIKKALARARLRIDAIDLWEINEAFAVVPMAAQADLGLDQARVNVFGGACALGHPIGASGARILVTLLNALETHKAKLGVAALCIGGGEGTAMVIESLAAAASTEAD